MTKKKKQVTHASFFQILYYPLLSPPIHSSPMSSTKQSDPSELGSLNAPVQFNYCATNPVELRANVSQALKSGRTWLQRHHLAVIIGLRYTG